MNRFLISSLLVCGCHVTVADTIHVTVGDTGCPGRQIGVIDCREKIPGVVSVTVLPRQPKEPAAQRVFVMISKSAPPSKSLSFGM